MPNIQHIRSQSTIVYPKYVHLIKANSQIYIHATITRPRISPRTALARYRTPENNAPARLPDRLSVLAPVYIPIYTALRRRPLSRFRIREPAAKIPYARRRRGRPVLVNILAGKKRHGAHNTLSMISFVDNT